MSTTTKKVSLFVKETLARMKGETDDALALNNQRKAIVVCKQELTALEASKFAVDEAIISAKENLREAKYPVTEINALTNDYLVNIKRAKQSLLGAEDRLEDIDYSIEETQRVLDELMM
jgi:hypothetical protein